MAQHESDDLPADSAAVITIPPLLAVPSVLPPELPPIIEVRQICIQ